MYRAPVSDIAFALKRVAGFGDALAAGTFPHLSEDVVDAVLGEAGRFAEDQVAPLNMVGDREGARLSDGAVTTASGWRGTYRAWCAGGWNGIAAPEAVGGQGLPLSLAAATQEMWNGACMAFALCPLLNLGAMEALSRHGADALKARYLPRLVSGEWTATMNLTEPQAGSDVGALRMRAEPMGDGTYRLFGQKIFITYGEHDLTENIVHLVLARLPDAPAGSKGLSLFLVPKVLVGEDGALGPRNDLFCAGLEKKLGIHAAPTCTMIFGDGRFGAAPGAVGYLIGEANRGLAAMFTMMNNARLMIGIQGVAQAERALQQATRYASERRQGRAPDGADGAVAAGESSLIAAHPDVRRMLMEMRALTGAARHICYACAFAADMAAHADGAENVGGLTQAQWQDRVDLLTPVAKAFSTDIAVEVASRGVQVHGGMGYIEETGAAQILRDCRIAPIYEGTNGIQAADLVMRKLARDDGAPVRSLIAELKEIADAARKVNRPDFGATGERVTTALDDLEAASAHLLSRLETGRTAEVLAGAAPYLRLFGLAAGGTYLAKGALAASGEPGHRAASVIAGARFAAEQLLPQTGGLRAAILDAEAVLGDDPALWAE